MRRTGRMRHGVAVEPWPLLAVAACTDAEIAPRGERPQRRIGCAEGRDAGGIEAVGEGVVLPSAVDDTYPRLRRLAPDGGQPVGDGAGTGQVLGVLIARLERVQRVR